MLQNLDTVIAFTVVMLLLSLVVTTVVQIVVSIVGLRGHELLWGISMLFRQADKQLGKNTKAARGLARRVLTHPALAPSNNLWVRIQDWIVKKLGLDKWITVLGGKRPPTAITLKDVRLVLRSLDDKKALDPEFKRWLSGLDKQAQAAVNSLIQGAGESVSRVEEWFDTVMDATAERFKLWSRWMTAAVAIVLAFGFQIDSANILHQLNNNPEIRARLVVQADEVESLSKELVSQSRDEGSKPADEVLTDRVRELNSTLAGLESRLQETELEIFKPIQEWDKAKWFDETTIKGESATGDITIASRVVLVWARLTDLRVGTVVTALLLSLGAPFWYGILANLVNFRSIVRKRQEAGAGG